MKKIVLIVLTAVLVCPGVWADSSDKSTKKSDAKRVTPAPKYNGQEKSNNGHGNNEDGVDTSNPGKSKAGEDTDSNVDDEKK